MPIEPSHVAVFEKPTGNAQTAKTYDFLERDKLALKANVVWMRQGQVFPPGRAAQLEGMLLSLPHPPEHLAASSSDKAEP